MSPEFVLLSLFYHKSEIEEMSLPIPPIQTPTPIPVTPVVPPNPGASVDWQKLLILVLTAALSLLSGLHINTPTPGPNPQPAPIVNPTPGPTPGPTPSPSPSPAPKPEPQPSPQPTPTPTPAPKPGPTPTPSPNPSPVPVPNTDPVACINVTDSAGNPITGDVLPGCQLVVSSEHSVHGPDATSLIWVVEPAVQKFVSPDGGTLVITTPIDPITIKIQQITALNHKIALASVTVKSGKAPQPPPGPGPTPIPDNGPTPIPATVKAVSIAVVEGAVGRTPADAAVMNNYDVWMKYKSAGNEWKFYDFKTKEANGLNAITSIQKEGVTGTAIVFADKASGKVLHVGKLPASISDVTAIVNQLTGANL